MILSYYTNRTDLQMLDILQNGYKIINYWSK